MKDTVKRIKKYKRLREMFTNLNYIKNSQRQLNKNTNKLHEQTLHQEAMWLTNSTGKDGQHH